jgi:hypothetical protein
MRAIVLILSAACLAAAQAPKPAPKQAAPARWQHPAFDPAQECRACHAATHSDVVAEWQTSKHGSRGVGCRACHGSLEAFVRKPGSEKCQACHPRQVDSMATSRQIRKQECWNCHPPHLLNPHLTLEQAAAAK